MRDLEKRLSKAERRLSGETVTAARVVLSWEPGEEGYYLDGEPVTRGEFVAAVGTPSAWRVVWSGEHEQP